MDKAYLEIKFNHPRIRDEFYEIPTNPHDQMVVRRYENATKGITLKVNAKDVSENVFACLARDRRTQEFVEYLISDSYNIVKEVDPKNEQNIIARFVFEFAKDSIFLFALAEDAAVASGRFEYVEDYYLGVRQRFQPGTFAIIQAQSAASLKILQLTNGFSPTAHKRKDDPLCSLSEWRERRVCETVLSSEYFFMRDIKSFQGNGGRLKCRPVGISFTKDTAKIKASALLKDSGKTHFMEWMFPCPTIRYS
jgi:hypothetical protein